MFFPVLVTKSAIIARMKVMRIFQQQTVAVIHLLRAIVLHPTAAAVATAAAAAAAATVQMSLTLMINQ